MRYKFFLLVFSLLLTGSLSFAQQFQASFSNTGNLVSFKIRPTADINTGFSSIEFYVRYPVGSPAFTFGDVVENTTNFPGMGDFTIINEGVVDGYNIAHFAYASPITTSRSYTSGTEYEVFNVKLIGPSTSTVDLQLVQSNDDDPFYVNITNQFGTPIRAPLTTIFYPTTDISGDPYFYQLAGVLLPVKWLSFYAERKNDNALLNWKVTSEGKNAY
ncbi:MAG TPA: hypothetical protein VM012_00375, partial [Flavitalea sp.]|nr:hypothetical protein [Flavitalea sp.]